MHVEFWTRENYLEKLNKFMRGIDKMDSLKSISQLKQ